MSRSSVCIRKGIAAIALSALLNATMATAAIASASPWTTANSPGGFYPQAPFLLTDGRLLINNAEAVNWDAITPDSAGSYATGSWSAVADAPIYRLYNASAVLNDGRVFFVGGEYSTNGSDTNEAAIYDPLANTWTNVPSPSWKHVGDAPCAVLPNGTVMVGSIANQKTAIYNPVSNKWSAGALMLPTEYSSTEESWQMLPGNKILTTVCYGPADYFGQLYDAKTKTWLPAGIAPGIVNLYSAEVGPEVLLPTGNVVAFGASPNNALYTTSTGSWSSLASWPNSEEAEDAPADMMPGGDILCTASPKDTTSSYPGPTYYYVYDPTANKFTKQPASPTDTGASLPCYYGRMLQLPTGQVLYTNGFASELAFYNSTGTSQAAWEPKIKSVTANSDGSYTLAGTQLTGLSYGASYGDDNDMFTSYPLVQLTSSSGPVQYARTYNFSTRSLQTGATKETTQFTVPSGLAAGTYSLRVVTNGIPSAQQSFVYTPPAGVVNIACGSSIDLDRFASDRFFAGGDAVSSASLVDMSGVDDPAPHAVYQTGRQGDTVYTIGDLDTTQSYVVRLHFTEDEASLPGQRLFDIDINGAAVLKSFDILSDAGAPHTAVIKQFVTTPKSDGTLSISLTGIVGMAKIDAIQVWPQS